MQAHFNAEAYVPVMHTHAQGSAALRKRVTDNLYPFVVRLHDAGEEWAVLDAGVWEALKAEIAVAIAHSSRWSVTELKGN